VSQLNSAEISHLFNAYFSALPAHVVHAPGRVNLIGEHTDYNDGFVLPAAINYSTWIAASGRTDRTLRVVAHDFDQQEVLINLDEPIKHNPTILWVNYVAGVITELQSRNYQLTGADVYIARCFLLVVSSLNLHKRHWWGRRRRIILLAVIAALWIS
jgi:galactokinase